VLGSESERADFSMGRPERNTDRPVIDNIGEESRAVQRSTADRPNNNVERIIFHN
jgi:hypothetical protein